MGQSWLGRINIEHVSIMMRNSGLAVGSMIEEERRMQDDNIETRSLFDKAVIWLGLGLASMVGLVAYLLVVHPLKKQGGEQDPENIIQNEKIDFSVDSERVLEVAKTQVTNKRSMVVFERGTGVLIEEPAAVESVALAKGALAFEAERQLKPVITSVGKGDFLVTHGPAVVTFLFEKDLKVVPDFWASYESAEEVEREGLLATLALKNLVDEAKLSKVVRVVKATSNAAP